MTVNKSFTPTIVAINVASTLSIQIRNNNASATNLTGVALTDFFPSGMVVGPTPTTSFTGTGCSGATITAPAGATSIAMTGASVNANAICTLSVKVVPNVAGNLIDTIPAGAVTSAQGVSNPLQGTATLASIGKINLTVTKTDGVTSVIPGNTTTYTIAVGNTGPDPVTGLLVNDPLPAGVTFTSWTCVGAAGGVCTASGTGAIADTVTIPKNGTVTYTVVAAVAPAATGSISNTVTLGVPGAVINTGATTATDTDTLVPTADLTITKTDNVSSVVAGTATTYTIVVTNAGPSNAVGAQIADTLPGAITSATYTALGTGGASGFTASGTGNINDTANLPAGSTITYTVVGNVSAAATGTLVNTATVTAPAGVTDPTPANNSATDTDTLAFMADLAITKTDNVTSVSPGTATTYTITVTNNGPSNVVGAKISDVLPATISSATYTAVGGGGASGFTASGSGNINDTSVNLPRNATVTYTLVANISAAATGSLANTATVTAPLGVTDPTPANNSATDTDTLTPIADLSITKTDGATTAVPGAAISYTIIATNNGPSDVTGATVADTLPATIGRVSWTCVASSGSSCTASGTGNINVAVNLLAGGTATFTVNGTVSSAATGTLANTATITAPAGVTDPTPGNNSATDTDTLAPQVTLAVAKTDGSANYTPGGTATYTITVTNTGASNASNVTVTDALPVGVTLSANATCSSVRYGELRHGHWRDRRGIRRRDGRQHRCGRGNALTFTVPVSFDRRC